MANGRAKAGGQIGTNGEFYQGGQFLPESKTHIKGSWGTSKKKAKTAKLRKVEIARREWAMQPTENHRAILMFCGTILKWQDGDNWGKLLEVYTKANFEYQGYTAEQARSFADRFNSGERWCIYDPTTKKII